MRVNIKCVQSITVYNKLAKARKMHKPPDTLGLKKFEPGKLWVENFWAQNISISFLAELDNFKNFCLLFFFYFLGGLTKIVEG